MSSLLCVGIVGVGYWGPNLLRNFSQHPSVKVKWICDLNSSNLKKLSISYPHIATTTHFQDLLSDAEVDLIVLATPPQLHYEMGSQALKANKHLLVTKPMARTELECLKLIDLAQQQNKLLLVEHTFVFHPAVDYLKKFVERGELGKFLYFESKRMNLGLYQSDVSVIHDLMSHDLSILNVLTDEDPAEICVISKNAVDLPQSDIAHLNLNFRSGLVASIQASWLSPFKIRQTILTGSKKIAVYDDVDMMQKIKVFDKGVDKLSETKENNKYTQFIQYRNGDIFSPTISPTEALKIETDHVVDCILNNKKPICDGHFGLRIVRLLEKAELICQQNSSWIKIPEISLAA